jgi:hypothetical protein
VWPACGFQGVEANGPSLVGQTERPDAPAQTFTKNMEGGVNDEAFTVCMGGFRAAAPVPGSCLGRGGLAAEAPKNIVAKKCLACHKDYKDTADIVAGDFNSLSNKANSITVKIEESMQLVKYTDETTVENVPEMKKLKSPIPVRVHYKKVGEDLVATKIVAKPEIKVPPEQLISTEELA